MYNSAKYFVKNLLPKRFLFKNEVFLRKLLLFKYRGSIYQCNICHTSLKNFIPLSGNDLLCPACGSRCRTRRLYKTLQNKEMLQGKILDFSPSRSLYRVLKKNRNINYFPTDYADEFIADYHYDITNIPVEDNFFDLILCYHILEHIEDDQQAMSELYRVLKPNSTCFIQTPFRDGNIYEDLSITTEAERLKAFGQKDHVRIYSINGLKQRLENAGFNVNVLTFTEKEGHYNGFKNETVLKAIK